MTLEIIDKKLSKIAVFKKIELWDLFIHNELTYIRIYKNVCYCLDTQEYDNFLDQTEVLPTRGIVKVELL